MDGNVSMLQMMCAMLRMQINEFLNRTLCGNVRLRIVLQNSQNVNVYVIHVRVA